MSSIISSFNKVDQSNLPGFRSKVSLLNTRIKQIAQLAFNQINSAFQRAIDGLLGRVETRDSFENKLNDWSQNLSDEESAKQILLAVFEMQTSPSFWDGQDQQYGKELNLRGLSDLGRLPDCITKLHKTTRVVLGNIKDLSDIAVLKRLPNLKELVLSKDSPLKLQFDQAPKEQLGFQYGVTIQFE